MYRNRLALKGDPCHLRRAAGARAPGSRERRGILASCKLRSPKGGFAGRALGEVADLHLMIVVIETAGA